jgi:mycofactocin precursor
MPPIEHSEVEEATGAIAEETLVEEVSIDGMCGVY